VLRLEGGITIEYRIGILIRRVSSAFITTLLDSVCLGNRGLLSRRGFLSIIAIVGRGYIHYVDTRRGYSISRICDYSYYKRSFLSGRL
jgi:hypothetical protein